MNLNSIQYIYFLGIGGIGMSALARYFNSIGKTIAGYDLTPTSLTIELQKEGIKVHFEDDVKLIPSQFLVNKENTLIVFTPAIPKENRELNYLKENNFQILKRAQILGLISKGLPTVAIAGTHGKTTTTTLSAHTLWQNNKVACAFLGGISKNYNTNMLLPEKSDEINNENTDNYYVVEADEFDRSFLSLYPDIAVITSTDADHLDIYGDKDSVIDAFETFANQIKPNGKLIYHENVTIKNFPRNIEKYSYSLNNSECDFYAKNIRLQNEFYIYDIVCPDYIIENVTLGIPGLVNVLNSIAVAAISFFTKTSQDTIKKAFSTFSGVKRRFDIRYRDNEIVFIDDYAHHPEELKAFITSVRNIYTGKKITGIFQPHLFSRTKDFADEFAKSLSLLDELILLDIYPAREQPIPGVSSQIIFDKVEIVNKLIISKNQLTEIVNKLKTDVLLTLGAGDIDKEADNIVKLLNNRKK
jgi:UDP-N-acetylmuramate--alanine ligase